MEIKLPKTTKRVIRGKDGRTVTTLLTGVENPSLKFVGVAQCSPLDTFDFEIGAQISYKRARRQLLVAIRNEIRAEIKRGERYADLHRKIFDDLTKTIDELKESLYDLPPFQDTKDKEVKDETAKSNETSK